MDEIKKLDETCSHCTVYKKDTPRPKSSLFTSTEFNEVVCMDLKTLSTGDLMLHAIDLFSRFSSTSIVANKHRETIIQYLFDIWISIFGPPKQFFEKIVGRIRNLPRGKFNINLNLNYYE